MSVSILLTNDLTTRPKRATESRMADRSKLRAHYEALSAHLEMLKEGRSGESVSLAAVFRHAGREVLAIEHDFPGLVPPWDSGKSKRSNTGLRAYLESVLARLRIAIDESTPTLPEARQQTERQTMPVDLTREKEFLYEVALSFAGEDRAYVRKVADKLQQGGIGVFFDEFRETEMWGEDLSEHLAKVYGRDSRFVVMFISKHYVKKAWPTHEKRHALAQAIAAVDRVVLLPARFDDSELSGMSPTVKCIDLRTKTPHEFADLIAAKCRSAGTKPPAAEAEVPLPTLFGQLRRPDACYVIAQELSTRSRDGRDLDPILYFADALSLLERSIPSTDHLKDLEDAAYELKRTGLAKLPLNANTPTGWDAIVPTDKFFVETDSVFQSWNPADDALLLCRLANPDGKLDAEKLGKQVGWSTRRINPALNYLLQEGLVSHLSQPLGVSLVFLHARLSSEARFRLEASSALTAGALPAQSPARSPLSLGEMWVGVDYPTRVGIDSEKLVWTRDQDVVARIQGEGYELVVRLDETGKPCRVRCHAGPDMTLLQRPKNTP